MHVGVDIGGTFTDIVLRLPDGTLRVSKVSSTPEDPGLAVVTGLAALLRSAGVEPGAVTEIVHGTTVASNTILQKTGAVTGLITTRGFRDVLEIGRVRTPDLYDLTWEKPVPLVPRRRRLEVDERIGADGAVVRPLDEAGVVRAAEHLAAAGAQVIAICFINSHANPAHEQAAERLVRQAVPGVAVSASWAVLPEMKEYERTSTTVVNGYLLPAMRRYLDDLTTGLARSGVRAPLLVVASNGGVVGARQAAERPVFVVGSGPAAGVTGAARSGRGARRAEPDRVRHGRHDRQGLARRVRSADPDHRVRVPRGHEYVEPFHQGRRLHAQGPGHRHRRGRHRGRLDRMDRPGWPPARGAALGRGAAGAGVLRHRGQRTDITDANVVLGYLDPERLAGGELKLDAALAREAIERHVAVPLGLSVEEAARGIRDVANASMARAIRAVTIERGRDPRDFTLVAFGGSGPAHACDVAAALDMRRVLVPVAPGVFTAVGMLATT